MTREEIIRSYLNAYNTFDVDGMLQDLHPDVVFENVAGGVTNLRLQGIAAFRQQAEQAKALFRSREQRITGITPAGEQVEVEIAYTGTLAADLPNGLKAGEVIALTGRSIFGFEGSRIRHLTDIS